MKYTKEQRFDIGKKIYKREITVAEASELFEVNLYTSSDYMCLFRDTHDLPPLDNGIEIQNALAKSKRFLLHKLNVFPSCERNESTDYIQNNFLS